MLRLLQLPTSYWTTTTPDTHSQTASTQPPDIFELVDVLNSLLMLPMPHILLFVFFALHVAFKHLKPQPA